MPDNATTPAITTDEEMRPIAVHVESIQYDVDLKHTYRRRVAVIDLELSYPKVQAMINELQKRLEEPKRGAIRVRFKGPMVLE